MQPKPSPSGSVTVYLAPLPAPPRVIEHKTPPLLIRRPHHPITCPNCPLQPLHMARPKPSRRAQFCDFCPNCLPRLVLSNARPHHCRYIVHTTCPHCPPAAVAHGAPKTELSCSVCGFCPTACPASRCRTQDPAAANTSSTSPHHLPPLHTAAIAHGAPKTEPLRSVLWFLASSPLSHLAFTSAQPSHHHHLIQTTSQPPLITLHCYFYWRTRNQAPLPRFSTFCLLFYWFLIESC
jgi:hypothetical protein